MDSGGPPRADECALAGAVGPDDPENLARANAQVLMVNGGQIDEAARELVERDGAVGERSMSALICHGAKAFLSGPR